MNEIIKKIDILKKELDSLRPIKEKDENILWEKFRLEWNFNSNHIEGNTMTYGDTKLLLRLGDEFRAQNNSLKDVNEMRAHDVAIFLIRDWAKDEERDLLEQDIKDLNKIILVKDYWADAQTTEGKPTRRLIKVGNYKKYPNSVILKSGEIFRYAEPIEVKPKMKELMEKYTKNQNEHPLITAAKLHYDFVLIHPFDDGNGRVSRLIMNYHLMKNGYPPLIIKSKDKSNYLYALNQADSGNINAFIEYLGNQLIWSLKMSIKAAKGESISERDDLYKEIEVWKKQLQSEIPTTPKRIDSSSMIIYDKSISILFSKIEEKAKTFNELFLNQTYEKKFKIHSNPKFFKFFGIGNYRNSSKDMLEKYRLEIALIKPLSKPDEKGLKISNSILVNLNLFDYSILINNRDIGINKNYQEFLTEEEIEKITKIFITSLYNKVKEINS